MTNLFTIRTKQFQNCEPDNLALFCREQSNWQSPCQVTCEYIIEELYTIMCLQMHSLQVGV